MPPKLAALARKAQQLADALTALEAQEEAASSFTPHPDTDALLNRRGVTREQLNYAVPESLDLKNRLNAYNLDNGSPGQGNIVAAVLDTFLRAEGYPPDLGTAKTS
ncbi:hypothetical protein ACFP0N_17380 [Kitasatospora aburaviensis]|uniref:Uncharacterized protein n=2 Tax=Kitasatospora aburaviensis TaxID=67265 RepID=A0ABW1EY29_9ACTN